MNDFTKDELLRMKNGIEYQSDLMHYPCKEIDACNKLSRKIQTLIDNYCEHENVTQDSAMVDCCLHCNWSGFK